MTPARPLLASMFVALVVVGCRVGANPSASPVAHGPRGAMLVLGRGGARGGVTAELLAVTDSGLLVQTSEVLLYPFGATTLVQTRDAPGVPRFSLRAPDPDVLRELAMYGRHPYGLSATHLATILRELGQDSVRVEGELVGGGMRARIIENHFLFAPPGPGPFPTVIAIPGCSGVAFFDPIVEANHPDLREDDRLFRRHYQRAADRLRREGFAVLLINVQGAEGFVTACGGEIPAERIAEYVDEAVAWAADLDFVDGERIHLIGWSMGGGGVLTWLRGPRPQSQAVRSAVTVYPDCRIQEPLTSPTPLIMLLGGADDIADPSECEVLVEKSGSRPEIVVHNYPGARHGYDITDAPPVLDIGGGMTIGYQQAAAEAAWVQILGFLGKGG